MLSCNEEIHKIIFSCVFITNIKNKVDLLNKYLKCNHIYIKSTFIFIIISIILPNAI